MLDKLPPQNIQAEQAVIGSILLGGVPTLAEVQEFISADDFYDVKTKAMFETLKAIVDAQKPIELITIQTVNKEIGLEYLFSLQNMVPTPAHARYYAQEVKKKSLARQRINQCHEELEKLYGGEEPADVISQAVIRSSELLAGAKKQKDIIHIKDKVNAVLDDIEGRKDSDGIVGIKTGFNDMDRKIGGLRRGNLILLAARPAMGKTTFALNIAKHTAFNLKIPTIFCSLEMTNDQLIEKLLAEDAGIDSRMLQNTTQLHDNDWRNLTRSAAKIAESQLYIDDSHRVKASELAVRLRRFKALHEIGLVIIDYLQIMAPERRTDKNNEVGETSGILQGLSKEINVPILALSQLSRDIERREDKVPKLSDLRDSGTLEQDAAQVMFLYRDDYYNPQKYPPDNDPSLTQLFVSKNRFGPLGVVDLLFFKGKSKFTAVDRRHESRESNKKDYQ